MHRRALKLNPKPRLDVHFVRLNGGAAHGTAITCAGHSWNAAHTCGSRSSGVEWRGCNSGNAQAARKHGILWLLAFLYTNGRDAASCITWSCLHAGSKAGRSPECNCILTGVSRNHYSVEVDLQTPKDVLDWKRGKAIATLALGLPQVLF